MEILASVVDKVINDARSTIEIERKATERQSELVTHNARAEISRLKDQNVQLTELLESERQTAMKARDNLVKRISSLLVDFTEERDRNLRDVVFGVQESNTLAAENVETFAKKHDVFMSEANAHSRAWGTSLDKAAAEGEKAKLSATDVSSSLWFILATC